MLKLILVIIIQELLLNIIVWGNIGILFTLICIILGVLIVSGSLMGK